MYNELFFYIPVLTILACAMFLLLSPKQLLRAQRFLVACMILVAFSLFLFAQFFNHHVVGYMGFDFLYSTLVSFCAPLYFYTVRLLTSPTGLKKYDWVALLPSAFELFLSIFCYSVMYANGEFEEFANYASHEHIMPADPSTSFRLVAFLGSQFFAAFMAVQIVTLVLLAHRLAFKYYRNLKNYYVSPEELFRHVFNINACSLVIIVIAAIIVAVPIDLLDTPWFLLPVCIVTSVVQIVLTIYAYKIDASSAEMCIATDETIEQPISTENSSEYAQQLIKLFDDEQLYLDPNLTLVTLAKKLGTNRTYASRLIQETHHMSFSDFINQCRINYAQELMRNSTLKNLKMSELSLKCGYASEQSFYRNFKNITGQTPTAWLVENVK